MTAPIPNASSPQTTPIRKRTAQDDHSRQTAKFANLLATRQAGRVSSDTFDAGKSSASKGAETASFLGNAAGVTKRDARSAIAEVFNEHGLLNALDARYAGKVKKGIARLAASLTASMGPASELGGAIAELASRLEALRAAHADLVSQLRPEDEWGQARSKLAAHRDARFLTAIAAVTGAIASSSNARAGEQLVQTDEPSADRAQSQRTRQERLMALLQDARSATNQLSLELTELGARIRANAGKLTREDRERLRLAIARLVEAFGLIVKEIRLIGDAKPQLPVTEQS